MFVAYPLRDIPESYLIYADDGVFTNIGFYPPVVGAPLFTLSNSSPELHGKHQQWRNDCRPPTHPIPVSYTSYALNADVGVFTNIGFYPLVIGVPLFTLSIVSLKYMGNTNNGAKG